MQIARVCDAACRACLYMAMSSRAAGPKFAWRGIVAGCGFAPALLRVFRLAALDSLRLPRS
eukprot:5743897-Pyramimonas_sp.AAC.1